MNVRHIIGGFIRRVKRLKPSKNEIIKNSSWYLSRFPHLSEYRRLKQGASYICIGSTPAKNAIDFLNSKENGYNLAVAPETIFYDFQVLKNYHSFLKKNGHIIFVLCPFTFLKDYYKDEYGSKSFLNERYYPILHRAMIDTFDETLYHKWVEDPFISLKEDWKNFLKCSVKSIIGYKTRIFVSNPDSADLSQNLCKKRVANWMREFHMQDLEPNHIPEETEKAIKGNIRIFLEMKEFIEERGYKATIVIPPFPKEMIDLLPVKLVQHTLFDPVNQIGIPYISFYGDEEWLSREFYYHGFLLNDTGRKAFTNKVIERIN